MDIIERLKRRADDSGNQELDRAAIDEIERLRAALRSIIEISEDKPWDGMAEIMGMTRIAEEAMHGNGQETAGTNK